MTGPTDHPPSEGTGGDEPPPRPPVADPPPVTGGRDYREVWNKALATPRRSKAVAVRTGVVWRWTLRTLAFVTPLAILLAFLLRPAELSTLPATVQGVWRTDATNYAKRRFEIRARSLLFQTGDEAIAVARFQITRARKSETPDGTLFQIEYSEDGATTAPLMFDFIFRGGDRPEIRFANQRAIVWTRSGDAASAAP